MPFYTMIYIFILLYARNVALCMQAHMHEHARMHKRTHTHTRAHTHTHMYSVFQKRVTSYFSSILPCTPRIATYLIDLFPKFPRALISVV